MRNLWRFFRRLTPQTAWAPVTALLLALLAFVQVTSALRESATGDEPLEIGAGYSYLKTGDFRLNPEHPPLAKMLQAIPLLRIGIVPPPDAASWKQADAYGFGMQLFNANLRKSGKILFAARAVSILLTLCLGFSISLWGRNAFGPAAALIALTLFVFDPTVNAHGHYAKNDIAIALFAFLACIAWAAVLTAPSRARIILAGVALGLAFATKFSALFLLPVLAILYAVHRWRNVRPLPLKRGLGAFVAVLTIAAALVVLLYWLPAVWHGVQVGGIDLASLRGLLDRSVAGARSRPGNGPFTAHPYVVGLTRFLDHSATGHRSYLLGEFRMTGWAYYFPVAFLVKEPLSLLAFLVLTLVSLARRTFRIHLRSVEFAWWVVLVPASVFCMFSFSSAIDIGIRHTLPVWPWIMIGAAAVFVRLRLRYAPLILAALSIGLVAESASIYPHYLAFFNAGVGGPANGPRILLDSNIDWGQDAQGLQSWLVKHRVRNMCVDYWGNANLGALGVSGPSLLRNNGIASFDCVAAISANFLYGLSSERGDFSWLRSVVPDARIGYSIYIYNMARLVTEGKLPLEMAPLAPAFAGVLHGDMHGRATAADPVREGEILAIYMTGLGPVSPPVRPGQPAPSKPLSRILVPLTCQWNASGGGPKAEVLFAGLAPALVGIYQVNILVPANLGDHRLSCSCEDPGGGRTKTATTFIP